MKCKQRHGVVRFVQIATVLAMMVIVGIGCSTQQKRRGVRQSLPPYSGPAFMAGSVMSMARLRNPDDYLLVSGYGVVANLHGTGSAIVPGPLRQKMYSLARKMGAKSPRSLFGNRETAIVVVEGLIPPGAVAGSRFDLLVSAVPQTDTTSLFGGMLWSTQLSVLGTADSLDMTPVATGRGPIYVNPFEDETTQLKGAPQAVIIGGGLVKKNREIELLMIQPNWQRVSAIADRINERFEHENSSYVFNTAIAVSDTTIKINTPKRYRASPRYLLALIRHLFIGRGAGYEYGKARQLGESLAEQPQHAASVMLAWEALGRNALPAIRDYYTHADPVVRMAALQAGAKLADERTTSVAAQLVEDKDAKVRQTVATLLGYLPRSLLGPKVLNAMLNDDDRQVRLVAYESLARIDDPTIHRTVFRDELGNDKFLLDLVPSDKPLIYIGHSPIPKVVIFDMMLGFEGEGVISMWDNRLMLRHQGSDPMKVFYQRSHEFKSQQATIAPALANLVLLMGHRPTPEHEMAGFDLQFSHVANVLHMLVKRRRVAAQIEIQVNRSAATIARYRQLGPGQRRPDIGQEMGVGAVDDKGSGETGG